MIAPMTFTLGTSPGQQHLPKQPSRVPQARIVPDDPASFPTLAHSLLQYWQRIKLQSIYIHWHARLPRWMLTAGGLLRHPPIYKTVPALSAGLSRTCSAEYEEDKAETYKGP